MRRWLTWNVWFRAQERLKGHPTFGILREMEAADRMPAAELGRVQREKLNDLLQHSYRNVPYFRSLMDGARVRPEDLREPAELRKLPITTKADVRAHRNEMRSRTAERLSQLATGGSTGEPLIFELGRRRTAARVACRQRVSRWFGLSVGDPEIALWGSPIELSRQDHIRSFRDYLLGTRLLSAFEMSEERMSAYLDILESGRYRQIFGYPSALYLLCLHAQRQARDVRSAGFKAAFVTGEVLYPHQRKLISESMNCPVADGYGGRDSGFISHECPHGRMHILTDAVVVEILGEDGRPVPPGELGQIVVTDLYSHDFPFIRYATGDLAVASSEECPCGRALPLLARVEGRQNDLIMAPDGRRINSLALIYPLREVAGIDSYRIRQKALDAFHIELVVNRSFDRSGENVIRDGWAKLLRTDVRVDFDYVESIPSEPRGKFRHVVSDLDPRSAAYSVSRGTGPEAGRALA
jgi:phenylacetate-CoA ligase